MIKGIIHTVVLVAAVLLLAQFVPLVAQHEQLALVLAVVIGLSGFLLRTLFVLVLVAVAAAAFFLFFH